MHARLKLLLVISAVLTAIMGKRYNDTGTMMPAGIVAGMSAGMSLFYLRLILAKPKSKSK